MVFYFDSLDSRERCLEMVVQQEQEVEDVKPAKATVYDYYQAEVALSTVKRASMAVLMAVNKTSSLLMLLFIFVFTHKSSDY